jgi:hypothetical protein
MASVEPQNEPDPDMDDDFKAKGEKFDRKKKNQDHHTCKHSYQGLSTF